METLENRRSVGRQWVKSMGGAIAAAVLVCLALYGVSVYLGFAGSNVFLTGAVIAAALISFYGFLWYGLVDGELSPGDLRTAITVSVVSVYLVLIGLVAFLSSADPSPITDTLLTSFTLTVSAIVGFYFAASAYVQINNGGNREQRARDRLRQDWERERQDWERERRERQDTQEEA